MGDGPGIRERMEVMGADGRRIGTVNRLELGFIKLARKDDPSGTSSHGYLGCGRGIAGDLIMDPDGGRNLSS